MKAMAEHEEDIRALIRPVLAYPALVFGIPLEIWCLTGLSSVFLAVLTAGVFLMLGQGLQLAPAGAALFLTGAVQLAWFYRATLIDPFYLMRLREFMKVRPYAKDIRSRVPGRGKRFVPG
ncbi:MAG: hypothetical protein RLW87_20330 [Alphaproteobacteria bacterium]